MGIIVCRLILVAFHIYQNQWGPVIYSWQITTLIKTTIHHHPLDLIIFVFTILMEKAIFHLQIKYSISLVSYDMKALKLGDIERLVVEIGVHNNILLNIPYPCTDSRIY